MVFLQRYQIDTDWLMSSKKNLLKKRTSAPAVNLADAKVLRHRSLSISKKQTPLLILCEQSIAL